jgi:CubicO group peptidase (beta-lactamase class C family)
MGRYRLFLVLSFNLVFAASIGFTQVESRLNPIPPAPTPNASIKVALSEIDEYIEKVQKDWNVPGLAVAIVKGDKVLFSKGYGVRRLDGADPVDADTLFAIASNSKAFTAAALAVLVEEGKLAWDDPVQKHFPEFMMPDPFVTREMTVRDLLCHRCGLDTFSGDLLWYDTNYSTQEVAERIRFLKPVSSFRSRYGYQNLMYIVAGLVIERVSGETWGEFVTSRFLRPLEMNRTTVSIADLQDNFASPHNESGGQGLRVLPLGNVDNAWGACGLNSSVNDLAKWMIAQLNDGRFAGKQILTTSRIDELFSPHTIIPLSAAARQAEPSRHFQAYGLGYVLHDWHGRKVVGHSGGLDGMISYLAMVPEEKLGVVVLTNNESSASRFIRDRVIECFLDVAERPDRSGTAVARRAAIDQQQAATRKKIDDARRSGTSPSIPLFELAGRYRCPMYGDVVVEAEGERLLLKLGPATNFVAELSHWHLNTFQIHWRESVKYNFPRGFVTFSINGQGQAERLEIDQPNDDFWFYELKPERIKE